MMPGARSAALGLGPSPAAAAAACRRRRLPITAAADEPASGNDGDVPPPSVMGDWRAFRAKLVAEAEGAAGWAARQAERNMELLRQQSPTLAREEMWAHPTGAPEAGGLLLAAPDAPELLGDDRMWQVVVFLMRHDEQGSMGLILNRPTSLNMGRGPGGLPMPIDGMETLREAFADSRLYCGGWRAQQVVTLLHGQRRLEGAIEVVPGIYVGGHEAAVAEVTTGGLQQSDFRFMAGVVAWEPGQLAREVAAGAWITAASSRSLVLKQCLQLPVPLWREAMALLGGDYAAAAKAARRDEEGSDSDDEEAAAAPACTLRRVPHGLLPGQE